MLSLNKHWAPVVQWIEHEFAELKIEVRFLAGALQTKHIQTPFLQEGGLYMFDTINDKKEIENLSQAHVPIGR